MAFEIATTENKPKKSPAACPNTAERAHRSVKDPAARLTNAQVRTALASVELGPGSPLQRRARFYAWTAGADPEDLLQEAFERAITTRSCPAHVRIEHYVMGIMRSNCL